MRLLYRDTATQKLCLTKPYLRNTIPEYTILSHTWLDDEEEVTFEDIVKCRPYTHKTGYSKLKFCLAQTERDGFKFTWVDTCCINRRDPTELSRAIHSMFTWYSGSMKCYAHLCDIELPIQQPGAGDNTSSGAKDLTCSRWFTRGWTLQELLAPACVEFYSSTYTQIGNKNNVADAIANCTKIDPRVLTGVIPVERFSMKARLSWGRGRHTTYPEDKAYCLIGLLGVSMPLVPGESEPQAMGRLREAMVQAFRDDIELEYKQSDEPIVNSVPPIRSTGQSDESEPMRSLNPYTRGSGLYDWLAFPEMELRKCQIAEPFRTTCAWVLQHPTFKRWLDIEAHGQHHGFLWIKGKPGAGKSTIVRFIEANMPSQAPDIHISYYFNARGTPLQKSLEGVYRSLLAQLLRDESSLRSILLNAFGRDLVKIEQGGTWTIPLLQKMLSCAMLERKAQYLRCQLDALDECDINEIQQMIDFFETVAYACAVKRKMVWICFASRHYPIVRIPTDLEIELDSAPAHASDIEQYVAGNLHIDPLDNTTAIHQEDIKRKVVDKANGVFLWTVLAVKILNNEYLSGRVYNVHQKLQTIPSELSQLFTSIIDRDGDIGLERFRFSLCWILFTGKNLSCMKFYAALAFYDSGDLHDSSEIAHHHMVNQVASASKGLAEVTKAGTVQLIHETVREFFLSEAGLSAAFPGCSTFEDLSNFGHKSIAHTCSRYLRMVSRSDGPMSICGKDEPILLSHYPSLVGQKPKYPLLFYAYHHALRHAECLDRFDDQRVFIRSFDFGIWLRLYFTLGYPSIEKLTASSGVLDILAFMGTSRLLSAACSYENLVRQHKHSSSRPFELLYMALISPNSTTIHKILKQYQITVPTLELVLQLPYESSPVEFHRSPLIWAIDHGRLSFAYYLVLSDQYIKNARDEDLQLGSFLSPIYARGRSLDSARRKLLRELFVLANQLGQVETIELLLSRHDQPVLGSRRLRSIPALASIESSAPNNAEHDRWTNALHRLEENCWRDIEIKDEQGQTILHYLAHLFGHSTDQMHEFCVAWEMLLERGADLHVRDHRGMTPLQYVLTAVAKRSS